MADDLILPDTTILSLDEARAAAGARAKLPDLGAAGLKRNASKEFVLTVSATIATGIGEKVYNLMSNQHAEQMAKLEAMCAQHITEEVTAVRAEFGAIIAGLERRSLRGRWRAMEARFRGWLDAIAAYLEPVEP